MKLEEKPAVLTVPPIELTKIIFQASSVLLALLSGMHLLIVFSINNDYDL